MIVPHQKNTTLKNSGNENNHIRNHPKYPRDTVDYDGYK